MDNNFNPDNSKLKGLVTHKSGSAGGMLVGNRHSEGGIKAINKSNNQPLEVEGGEVIITRPAVSDDTKRLFEGKMMTNREILSKINSDAGGVSFADGGEIEDVKTCGREYEYGGKIMKDYEIVSSCGCKHSMAKGGDMGDSSQVKEYSEKAIATIKELKEKGDFEKEDVLAVSRMYAMELAHSIAKSRKKKLGKDLDSEYKTIFPKLTDEIYAIVSQKFNSAKGVAQDKSKISFSRGTIEPMGDYFDVKLFNAKGERVYSATVDEQTAKKYIYDYKNINLINDNSKSYAKGGDLNDDGESLVNKFAEMLQEKADAYYTRTMPKLMPPIAEKRYPSAQISVKPKTKYILVDSGTSGKFMFDKEDKHLYGIKGYGVINRGHDYGLIEDLINSDFSFDGYSIHKNSNSKREIVLNEGNGIILNNLFRQWDKIKTEDEHKEWVNAVKSAKFGTYGNIPILHVLEKFNPKFLNEVEKKSFYEELNNAVDSYSVPTKEEHESSTSASEFNDRRDLISVLWEEKGDMKNLLLIKGGDKEIPYVKLLSLESGNKFLWSNWIQEPYFKVEPFYNGNTYNASEIENEVVNLIRDNKLNSIKKGGVKSTHLVGLKLSETSSNKKDMPEQKKSEPDIFKQEIADDKKTLNIGGRYYINKTNFEVKDSDGIVVYKSDYLPTSIMWCKWNSVNKIQISDIPELIKDFMPKMQQKAIVGSVGNWETLISLFNIIKSMPRTYETDGIPSKDKIIYLHYFSSSSDWYIVEKDSENEQLQAYGYTILNGDTENADWGYINIEEIKSTNRIDLDFNFDPIKFSDLRINEDEKTYHEESVESEFLPIENEELQPEKSFLGSVEEQGLVSPNIEPKEDIIDSNNITANTVVINANEKLSSKKQFEINNAVETLVRQKGSKRELYSQDEIAMLKLWSGSGSLAKQGATGTGLLDQFFTPAEIVSKMWGLALKYGFTFKNSNILEPAVGVGRFFANMPTSLNFNVVGYDIDETAVTICKVLYPLYDIKHASFETMFFTGRRHIGLAGLRQQFDLVISNPPYRPYVSEYSPLGEKDATGALTFEMYFIMRGVDVLKKGGLLIMIIPNTFMSNDNKYNDFKEKLAKKADLIDAYRLPNGVFPNTEVGTDIIVLRKK